MRAQANNFIEDSRLEALRRCNILDTPPEPEFDQITALAASICKVPISLISLVDETRLWFKSAAGINIDELPRAMSFCSFSIQTPSSEFIVEDATKDSRFADNPIVQSPPYVRFYAAAPLVLSTGEAIGTLCIIDSIPRSIERTQILALRYLRDQVMLKIEERILFEELAIANRLEQKHMQTEPCEYSLSIMSCLRQLEHVLEKHSRLLFKTHNITLLQYLALQSLEGNNRINVAALADLLSLSSSTLVGIADRLEERGLIQRQRDKSDRRAILLTITPAGSELLKAASALTNPIHVALSQIDNTQKHDLFRSLQRVVMQMETNNSLT